MILDGLELHNVGECEAWDGWRAGALHRVPRAVADRLGSRGRWIALGGAGIELRFVTDAPTCHLYVGSLHGPTEVTVYRGDVRESIRTLATGGQQVLELHRPEMLAECRPGVLQRRFAPEVWRIQFGDCQPLLHRLDTHGYPVRPPTATEKPRFRWLAYGSSITMGSAASRYELSYVDQAAERLGIEACNLGMAGSCLAEPEMAAFLASIPGIDLVTLELGINMHEAVDEAEFRLRSTRIVDQVQATSPGTPIALITHFLYRAHLAVEETRSLRVANALDGILRTLAASRGLILIEGRGLLSDAAGLTTDLVHPADAGMRQIGERLAAALSSLVRRR